MRTPSLRQLQPRLAQRTLVLCVALLLSAAAAETSRAARQEISLNGSWEIAEGSLDAMPREFDRQVPVPGLVDLAKPAFAEVGNAKSAEHRKAFWYRRSFTLDGPAPESAWLKVNKAMYGTRVFVNGKLVGDHLPCFTPGWFDVRPFLAPPGQPNELVIRVGIRESLPKAIPDGWDPEKPNDDHDYVPGIYDSVDADPLRAAAGRQRADGSRCGGKAVRVVAEIEGHAEPARPVMFRVSEAATRQGSRARLTRPVPKATAGEQSTCEFRSATAGSGRPNTRSSTTWMFRRRATRCGRGSACGASVWTTQTGHAVLNGRPYFLRGTTLCPYRFFADPKRGDLPWREDWVRKLHRVFKDMHWNSMRYCIGFPPEQWYRIADEEGLLVQDEFPLWCMNSWPKEITSKVLDRTVHRVDARAMEPSVRGDLGCAERDRGRPVGRGARPDGDGQGDCGGPRPRSLEPAVGQRLGRAGGAGRLRTKPIPTFSAIGGSSLPISPCFRAHRESRAGCNARNCRTHRGTRSSSTNTAGGTCAGTAN